MGKTQKKKAGKNFYVVIRGRFSGIFDAWEICKDQVQCRENNKYKGFYTLKEAVAYFRVNMFDIDTESGYVCQLMGRKEYFDNATELVKFMEEWIRMYG